MKTPATIDHCLRFAPREGMMNNVWKMTCAATAIGFIVFSVCAVVYAADAPAVFSGGHDTDPRDEGRPVALIAAALGVEPEVFREAFRGVTPARDGKPSREEARRNKEALLKVLGPHGVTNERLDEVSDYYRYRPQSGKLWRHRPARAHAVVADGKVTRIVVTDPGAGYSSLPRVAIKGFEDVELTVTLRFDQDLTKNGSIKSIQVKK